jgi:hypothetical protein
VIASARGGSRAPRCARSTSSGSGSTVYARFTNAICTRRTSTGRQMSGVAYGTSAAPSVIAW